MPMKTIMLKKKQYLMLCLCFSIIFLLLGIVIGLNQNNDKDILYTILTNNITFYLIVFFFSYMNTDIISDYFNSNFLLRYSTLFFFIEQICIEIIRLLIITCLTIVMIIAVNFTELNIFLYFKIILSFILFFLAVNLSIKITYVFIKNATASFAIVYSTIILLTIFIDNLHRLPVSTKFICLFPLFEVTPSQEIIMFILMFCLNLFLLNFLCFIFKKKDGGIEKNEV